MPGCWPKSLPQIVVECPLRRYSTWFGTVAIAMVLVAIAVVPTSRAPLAADSLDVASTLERSKATLAADLAAWGKLSFRRQVTRQRFDADWDESWRQELDMQVTPEGEGFDEELRAIDGRSPTEREIKEHRKAGRFEKHYRLVQERKIENPFGEDLPLLPAIYSHEYRYVGEQTVEGTRCHRLVFDAVKEVKGAPTRERLLSAMKGSLCLSVDGLHAIEFETETTRVVSSGLLKSRRMALRLEFTPVEDHWVPRLIRLDTDANVTGKNIRKRNTFRYSGFRRPDGRSE
jgi:hypothetical protein